MHGTPPSAYGVVWSPFEDRILAYGVNFIKFWTLLRGNKGEGQPLTLSSPEAGSFGNAATQTVTSAAFLPSGVVLSGSPDGYILSWKKAKCVGRQSAHGIGPEVHRPDGRLARHGVRALVLRADRKTLLSGGADGVVKAWDVRCAALGCCERQRHWVGNTNPVSHVMMSIHAGPPWPPLCRKRSIADVQLVDLSLPAVRGTWAPRCGSSRFCRRRLRARCLQPSAPWTACPAARPSWPAAVGARCGRSTRTRSPSLWATRAPCMPLPCTPRSGARPGHAPHLPAPPARFTCHVPLQPAHATPPATPTIHGATVTLSTLQA